MKGQYRKAVFIVVYRKSWRGIKFLTLKRKKHWKGWEFPKGGIEKNESLLQTVKRETKEETGSEPIKIQKHNFSGKYQYKRKLPDRQKIIGQTYTLYSVEIKNKKIKIDKREHSNYKWLNFQKAKNILTHPNQKKALTIVNNWLKK